MKVLLAGPDCEENLSIRYLSAALTNAGHNATLAAFNASSDIAAVADAAHRADLVGLSMCFQARASEFLQLARRIKASDPGKLVVAGGHYASCAAEGLLANHPEIDVIAIHEGERTLVEIADAMGNLDERLPAIAGIAYRDGQAVRFTKPRPMLDDLDALPFPDRSGPVHFIAGVPTSYLMGSRGCFGSCAYCCITSLHRMAPGKQFRQRSVARIADEMAGLYRERGARQFVFHDDNFLVPSEAVNHARISAFEKALKMRGVEDIALLIKCRPADAKSDVLQRLKALGLVRLFLGVESATSRGLAVLDRNQSVEDSERALETCARLDISAQFTLMTFNPDATLDTLRSDVAFMRRFCGNPLNFCRTEIYAGTPLERRMIDAGRARGNYLARVYSMLDPVADLACNTSIEVFPARCWSNASLMQNTIGLDHTAAVLKRFYKGVQAEGIAGRVGEWVRSVNCDTIDLLEEIIERSASAGGCGDAGFRRDVKALTAREAVSRQAFHAEGMRLRAELEAFSSAWRERQNSQTQVSWPRLAKQAVAALLALGMPTTVGCHLAMAQQGSTATAAEQEKGTCSLKGKVTDPEGSEVPGAKITITNEATGAVLSVKTNSAGQYLVNNLGSGSYRIVAEMPGFKASRTQTARLAGTSVTVDLRLEILNDLGCCEYVAMPLVERQEEVSLFEMDKPLTYVVGTDDDHGTFRGIAELVYGNSKLWLQIFEANRDVVPKPGVIPSGTTIVVPSQERVVPKLLSKVTPVYPPAAAKAHVWGDVLLDVTIADDGTVAQTSVIDGNPLLAEAAASAVKRWRYQPVFVGGKPVFKFVVLVSFGKSGKVR